MAERPDVLLIMTDQQRADTIKRLGQAEAAFGKLHVPNFDRLVQRGDWRDHGEYAEFRPELAHMPAYAYASGRLAPLALLASRARPQRKFSL